MVSAVSCKNRNMHCQFSTLTFVNMANAAFLPGWAKYWEKDMRIRNVSRHRMFYQTWKNLWWLWLQLNIERWKGRCKWHNKQWLQSFSPGDTATMKKVAVAFSVNKLGMTEEKIETYWGMSPNQPWQFRLALRCFKCYFGPNGQVHSLIKPGGTEWLGADQLFWTLPHLPCNRW